MMSWFLLHTLPTRKLAAVVVFFMTCAAGVKCVYVHLDYQALLDLDDTNEVPSTVGASEGEIRRNPSFLIK